MHVPHFATLAVLALAACTATPVPMSATAETTACPGVESLSGDWDVALQFDPSAPPSATTMSLSLTPEGALEGSFYGSDFETAKFATTNAGEIVLAATTSDESSRYFHSARYDCASRRMAGQTLSPERDFLMSWTADRRDG